MNESAATALMHLEMICLTARGDYSLKPGDLEKRKAAVLAFMFTGQCVADDTIRELSAKITEVVTSHFLKVNETAADAA